METCECRFQKLTLLLLRVQSSKQHRTLTQLMHCGVSQRWGLCCTTSGIAFIPAYPHSLAHWICRWWLGGGWTFWLSFPLQYGYAGVTLFFVVSGFCIHWPQARNNARSGMDGLLLRDFVWRRFWRLYPPHFASLVFSSLALGLFPSLLAISRAQAMNWGHVFALKDVAINATFLQQIFPSSLGFNGVYWTLLYEVQFYLFYPLLLWAMRRSGKTVMLVTLFGCELLYTGWVRDFHWLHVIPCFFLGRYFEWYLGMYAAELIASSTARPSIMTKVLVLTGGLALGIGTTFSTWLWPLRDLCLSIGFFGVLIIAASSSSTTRGYSSVWAHIVRILAGVGLFSYSLYLIHVPVIDVVWNTLKLGIKSGWLGDRFMGWCALLSIPFAFVTAYWFYHLIEKPSIRMAQSNRSGKAG